jgi:hypothetical protein
MDGTASAQARRLKGFGKQISVLNLVLEAALGSRPGRFVKKGTFKMGTGWFFPTPAALRPCLQTAGRWLIFLNKPDPTRRSR